MQQQLDKQSAAAAAFKQQLEDQGNVASDAKVGASASAECELQGSRWKICCASGLKPSHVNGTSKQAVCTRSIFVPALHEPWNSIHTQQSCAFAKPASHWKWECVQNKLALVTV